MRFNNRLSRWCEHYHVVAVGYLRTLGHVAQGRIDVPPFPTLPSPSLSRARFQDGPSLVLRTSSVRAAESRGAITHTHTLSLSVCLSVVCLPPACTFVFPRDRGPASDLRPSPNSQVWTNNHIRYSITLNILSSSVNLHVLRPNACLELIYQLSCLLHPDQVPPCADPRRSIASGAYQWRWTGWGCHTFRSFPAYSFIFHERAPILCLRYLHFSLLQTAQLLQH